MAKAKTEEFEESAPAPAVAPSVPGLSIIEQACAEAKITLSEVKRFDHSGDVVTFLTVAGRSIVVDVGHLFEPVIAEALAKKGKTAADVKSVDRAPDAITVTLRNPREVFEINL